MSLVSVTMGMIVVVAIVAVVMMVVAAIGSMHMRRGSDALVVAVLVVRVAVMDMIVRAMSMALMIMTMTMFVIVTMIVSMDRSGGDISAAFGIERRLDGDNAGAKAPGHILDDGIAPDAKASFQQFGRQMAIAEVPGDAGQCGGVGAANLGEAFRGRNDLDDAPILQRQTIAGAQHHGVGQVQKKCEAPHPGHRDATAVAVVIIEDNRVGGFAGPGAGGTNGMSVQHGPPEGSGERLGAPLSPLPYAPWAL